ncbi:DUF6445 family protein [Roseateles asaccharophilus]|uniref:2-oxoglutarate-Fe(II)-dependent oxygenase superfamily protein n=1 Tax=Roseateles asaccharophilus TaxID=582607 RepID=A0ABU2A9W4_9BURK|nr:DUF6445 family protein [Roseateles asaccharophilus]MDR7333910.1 hypothetical protein [Roseateles asaccharophilus]
MTDDPFAIRMPPEVRSVRVGGHQVVLIDDFLADPRPLADAARTASYAPYPGVAERKGYPGVRAPVPADYSAALTALVEPLVRQNFGVPDTLALHKSECAFSLTTVAPGELGALQRTPHFDASSPHHMAVLLYLCDDAHGGTGFYRHKATGLQQITAGQVDAFERQRVAELDAQAPAQRYFDDSDDCFEFLGMMPARFNRLVVYRGSLLHSAIVNPQRLSADPRTGRLTVNSFYDFW